MRLEPGPIPLYHQLRETLARRIAAGEFLPGAALPSEAAICQEYGVSRITAARALAELARDRIVVRQQGRGTFVRAVPAPGASGRVSVTALVVPTTASPWCLEILYGMDEAAEPRRQQVSFVPGDGTARRERERLGQLVALGVDGAVLYPVEGCENAQTLRELAARRFPLAFVGRYYRDLPIDRVVADNVGGARSATEHLLARGHRRIAFVYGAEVAVTSAEDREAGFHSVMRAAGVDVPPAWVIAGSMRPHGEAFGQGDTLLAHLAAERVTAAVAVNDNTAITLMLAARRAGWLIPDDLAITGFNDQLLAALLETPLTSVAVPIVEMGRLAMTLVQTRIGDRDGPPRSLVVPTRLVVRASTDAGGVGEVAAVASRPPRLSIGK